MSLTHKHETGMEKFPGNRQIEKSFIAPAAPSRLASTDDADDDFRLWSRVVVVVDRFSEPQKNSNLQRYVIYYLYDLVQHKQIFNVQNLFLCTFYKKDR
jgi:hypothetical protein